MTHDHLTAALLDDVTAPAEFSPIEWMFTTETIAGGRTFLSGLAAPGELWEYNGRYFPVRAGSDEAVWLRGAGATLIPPRADAFHHRLDAIVAGLAHGVAG
jgi:hypothetical protein